MPLGSGSDAPVFRNELLSALTADDIQRLRPHLRRVTLVVKQLLHEAAAPMKDVYFVEEGLVSLTADTRDNGMVEVGMTGRDGLVGTPVLLNPDVIAVHRAMVQVAGSAFHMQAAVLREVIDQVATLRDRCLRYVQMVMIQTSQSAACNARHELPERLARWLLMIRDRTESDELPLTQEFLSAMLGVRRAGVSVVVSALQSQGLIQQARGRLILLDRAGLEGEACSCYRMIEDSRKQIMGGYGDSRGSAA